MLRVEVPEMSEVERLVDEIDRYRRYVCSWGAFESRPARVTLP
jgi:hypothetical protein